MGIAIDYLATPKGDATRQTTKESRREHRNRKYPV